MDSLNNFFQQLLSLPRSFKKIILLIIDTIILSILFISLCYIFLDQFRINTNLFGLYLLLIVSYLVFANFIGVYNWIIRQININFNSPIIISMSLTLLLSYLSNLLFFKTNLSIFFFLFFILFSLIFITLSRLLIFQIYSNLTTLKKFKKNSIIIFDKMHLLDSLDLSNIYFKENITRAYVNLNTTSNIKRINNLKVYEYSSEKLSNIFDYNQISSILLICNDEKKIKKITSDLFKFNIGLNFVVKGEFISFSIDPNISKINFNYILEREIIINNNLISKKIINKKILVTGGGGSIGSELVNQLIKFHPNKIIVLDISEYNLYALSKKLDLISDFKNIDYLLGSVTDYNLLDKLLSENKFDYIFHAAAYKHVNITQNNIIQVFKNNYLGTKNLVDLSIKYKILNFVNISTDKAVNSTNYMGYSKRLSEIYIQLSNFRNVGNNFSIIRFGNVLGSSGSAIPLFLDQILNRKNVTVTHKKVSRYFMTISEAVSLVLETVTFKEKNLFYVLNMGEPLNILSLVKKLININGLQYKDEKINGDIEIEFIGLKEGEKLNEELFYNKDYFSSINNNIFNVEEKFNKISFEDLILKIEDALDTNDETKIRQIFKNQNSFL